jgi:hypothetical protein
MPVTRATRIAALIAAACFSGACGGKHPPPASVGTGDGRDAAMPKDAQSAAPMDAEVISPPAIDGGHDASTSDAAPSDDDAGGPRCSARQCSGPSDECNVGYCDRPSGECMLRPRADGTACGSRGLDNCTAKDTCLAGTCVANDSPAGTPCGDQGKDCHLDDQCDGQGQCVDKGLKADGTACGDQLTNTECDAPDSCDAAGVCQSNYAAPNAACGDQQKLCNFDDSCDGQGKCIDSGLWMKGNCPVGETTLNCLCGSTSLNECHTEVDMCMAGTCVFGNEPDGKPCGDKVTNTECNKPDACLGGACSPSYVQNGGPCGDQGIACMNNDTCDGQGGCTDNGVISPCP